MAADPFLSNESFNAKKTQTYVLFVRGEENQRFRTVSGCLQQDRAHEIRSNSTLIRLE